MQEEYLELKKYILSSCIHFSIDTLTGYKYLPNDSSYLFDLRELLLHPYYGKLAAKLVWNKIRKYEIRLLFGQGVGSIPLMTLIQQVAKELDNVDLDILVCREARKKTNRQRLVEGIRPTAVPRAMFIDDLTNTGSTYRKCIKALKEENINLRIMGAAGILDFWAFQGTRQLAVQNSAIEYLFRRHDLGLTRTSPNVPVLGAKKYSVLTSNTYPRMDLKSPAAIDNRIAYWATDTQSVYAMNIDTGEVLWSFDAPDQEDWQDKGIINKLLIDSTGVYFNTYNGIAFKLNKLTGETIWAVKVARWLHSSSTPSEDGTKIFLSTESRNETDSSPSGDFVCLNSSTGEELWRLETQELAPCTPHVVSSTSKVIVGNNLNELYCLNADNGNILWKINLAGPVKGKVNNVENVCCATTENGYIYFINIITGTVLSENLNSKGFRHVFVTVVNNTFIVSDIDGYVKAFSKEGTLIWINKLRGKLFWYPAVKDNTLYFATRSGYVFAIDASDGSKKAFSYIDESDTTTLIGAPPAVDSDAIVFHTTNKGLLVYELSY